MRELVFNTDRRPAEFFLTPHQRAMGEPLGRYLAIDGTVVSTFISVAGDHTRALQAARKVGGRARDAGVTVIALLRQQLNKVGCNLDTMPWDFRSLAFDFYLVPSPDTCAFIEDYVTAIMHRSLVLASLRSSSWLPAFFLLFGALLPRPSACVTLQLPWLVVTPMACRCSAAFSRVILYLHVFPPSCYVMVIK